MIFGFLLKIFYVFSFIASVLSVFVQFFMSDNIFWVENERLLHKLSIADFDQKCVKSVTDNDDVYIFHHFSTNPLEIVKYRSVSSSF